MNNRCPAMLGIGPVLFTTGGLAQDIARGVRGSDPADTIGQQQVPVASLPADAQGTGDQRVRRLYPVVRLTPVGDACARLA